MRNARKRQRAQGWAKTTNHDAAKGNKDQVDWLTLRSFFFSGDRPPRPFLFFFFFFSSSSFRRSSCNINQKPAGVSGGSIITLPRSLGSGKRKAHDRWFGGSERERGRWGEKVSGRCVYTVPRFLWNHTSHSAVEREKIPWQRSGRKMDEWGWGGR